MKICSERILLRSLEKADAKAIFAYRSLPEVAKYQYWEPFTEEQALTFATRYGSADSHKKDNWLAWAVIEKENNNFIGDCALKIINDKAEIGCNIAPRHQHRGYAKEVLNMLFDYCFDHLGIEEIFGITDSENTASVKLMESLQMTKLPDFEGNVMCKGRLSIEHQYSIKKSKRNES